MSMFRKTSALPFVLLGGLAIGLPFAAPASAQGVSNGVVSVEGYRAGGNPVIQYGPGSTEAVSSGVFVMRGGSEGGARVEPGPGAHGGFGDGGVPVFLPGGHGEVAYGPAPSVRAVVAEAAPVAVAPAINPAAPVAAPQPLPEAVRAQLASAEAALEHGRAPLAEARIEAAETALLNDRQDGDTGWGPQIGQMENALAALRGHDTRQAAAVVKPLASRG